MPVIKNGQDNYVKMRAQGMDDNNCRTNTLSCNHGRETDRMVWQEPVRRGTRPPMDDPPLPLMTVQRQTQLSPTNAQ